MEPGETLTATLWNAVDALGRGFDVTSDQRLLYCKGPAGSRLVTPGEGGKKDFAVSENVVLRGVWWDVDVDVCDRRRERIGSDAGPLVFSFQKVHLLSSFYFFLLNLWTDFDFFAVWNV